MYLAAQCFRDTLIEVNVPEESVEKAFKAFLSLKKKRTVVDSSYNEVIKIASKISSQLSKNLSFKSLGNKSNAPEETKQESRQNLPLCSSSNEDSSGTPELAENEEEKCENIQPSFNSEGSSEN